MCVWCTKYVSAQEYGKNTQGSCLCSNYTNMTVKLMLQSKLCRLKKSFRICTEFSFQARVRVMVRSRLKSMLKEADIVKKCPMKRMIRSCNLNWKFYKMYFKIPFSPNETVNLDKCFQIRAQTSFCKSSKAVQLLQITLVRKFNFRHRQKMGNNLLYFYAGSNKDINLEVEQYTLLIFMCS